MNRYLVLLISGMILTGLLVTLPALSQVISDPEAEYLRIREVAFSGDYVSATAEIRRLINEFPEYGDARVLLGRILAWQMNYDQAIAVIDSLLATDPDNEDALSARRDILMWSKDLSPAITDIRTGYSFDSFEEPYSRFWQVFKAGAGHRFKWGPANAGINIGNVIAGEPAPYNVTEFQIETEAYPTLSEKNYGYIAYAFSPGKYFPSHKAAIEIWQIISNGWAASAGLNYYYFDRNIFIAGLSVEKYISRYWFSARSFIYFKNDKPTTSFYFNCRRYFTNTNFLQLTFGTGTAPDEPFDIQTDIMRLSANSIRIAFNRSLGQKVTFRAGAGYSYEEYAEGVWRNRFEGHIGVIYALKLK